MGKSYLTMTDVAFAIQTVGGHWDPILQGYSNAYSATNDKTASAKSLLMCHFDISSRHTPIPTVAEVQEKWYELYSADLSFTLAKSFVDSIRYRMSLLPTSLTKPRRRCASSSTCQSSYLSLENYGSKEAIEKLCNSQDWPFLEVSKYRSYVFLCVLSVTRKS